MSVDPVTLLIASAGAVDHAISETQAILAAGVPVVAFVNDGSARALAYRAKVTPRGFLVVAADVHGTGTFMHMEGAMGAATRSAYKA